MKEMKEKMTKRKHLLYKGLGVSGLYPCREVMIRVSCFIAILLKGVRGQKQNERYSDKRGRVYQKTKKAKLFRQKEKGSRNRKNRRLFS